MLVIAPFRANTDNPKDVYIKAVLAGVLFRVIVPALCT